MRAGFRVFDSRVDWEWITERQPIHMVDDTTGVMAIDITTGDTVAACIMDNWTRNSVEVHLIIDRPMVLRHGFLDLCAHIVFNDMGCARIYGQVPGNNEKALRLNKHLGFVEKTRLIDAVDEGVDYILMEVTRDTWTGGVLEQARYEAA